ncbi:Exonuclease V gamma subunit,exodeoxyribonuclease V, gamma subunit,Exodeoxyribonuclease V, gamma subunit [Chlamydia serpentis]|uniref:Exonuclease V gamma subunit,exodeoxyribonuclease V, gamma subunit,Exodeoxyribonuclease V, gamma subunit n=2 Tax=Chlamydia serpentis TaxID=1967782 RepID=A0A2R8FBQ9_9CHLA|nr:Exonuclease V gamma subunit,exodeoxyribonuclease V, gamma subunit,Exodeoxyribonuclease V, gamma subunit [Chlamydia serpentis]
MGSTIFTSSDSIVKHFFSSICQSQPNIPDYLTLPLLINNILENTHGNSRFQKSNEFLSQPNYEASKKLASLFKKFYTFSQTPKDNAKHYQQLFQDLEGHFSSYEEIFSTILNTLPQHQDCSLHIFGYAHLPKHISEFFINLSKFFPVYFYCFSPCREYFGDLLSDRAIDFFWNQLPESPIKNAWEHYVLSDRQTLLANLAHKSQASQNFFLDREIDYQELFITSKNDHALGVLQNSILDLKPIFPENISQTKPTISIYKALNASREVQELFCKVTELLHQGVLPEEIFILSSHIDSYRVHLNALFQPHLPIYFIDEVDARAEDLRNKILLLSSILQTQGDLNYILELLTHPQLQQPLEQSKITYLIKKLSAEWERIPTKDRVLGQQVKALGDLIIEEYPFDQEGGRVSQVEIWETTVPLIYAIQDCINLFITKPKHSYEDLFHHLFSFLEKIFLLSPEEMSFITSLKNSLFPTFATYSCSLTFFTDFCLDFLLHLHKPCPFYDKPGPYVGSLSSLSLIPKGYTFILGANKTTSFSILDLLNKATTHEELAFSSTEDEENFHFLQILVSTKYELHITYISSAAQFNLPSPFLNHIKETLNLPTKTLATQPYLINFFTNKVQLHTSQAYNYFLAKAFYSEKSLFPSLFIQETNTSNLPDHLSLYEIVNGIFAPLDLFLKTNYNVKISPPEHLKKQPKLFPTKHQIEKFWKELFLDKERDPAHNISLHSEELFTYYREKMGVCFDNLNKDVKYSPYTVVFSSSIFEERPYHQHFLLPPLSLSLKESLTQIHGTIHGVCSQGIYLCAIDPSGPLKKTKKNSGAIPDTLFEQKELLEKYLALAALQACGHLDLNSVLIKLLSFKSKEIIFPPFLDAKDYLLRILEVYNLMCSKPIPILSPACWQTLHDEEKFHHAVFAAIDEDLKNPNFPIFWKFHNRNIQGILKNISESERLKILSLFKGTCAAV